MSQRRGPDRIWTVANLLTGGRLVLLGAFLGTLDANRYLAFSFLALMGVTDFLDGFVARHFDQQTNLGKVLDPVIDRVVLFVAIVAITIHGAVPGWLAAIVLIREGALLLGGVVLRFRGVRTFDVIRLGKVGTFGLMCAFPTFVLADGTGHAASVFRVIAWVMVLPSVAISWAAAVEYFPNARRAIAEQQLEPGVQ